MFKRIVLFLSIFMLIGSMAFAEDMCSCVNSSKTAPSFVDDGHTFTMKIICLDCNLPKSVETRITHTYVNGVCACGEICNHNYTNGKCPTCGLDDPNYAKPCEHDWVLVKELEPNCIEAGYKWWECSKCNFEKSGEVGEPTGIHDYHWVVAEEPTALKDGSSDYKCKVCGHIEKSKVVKYTKWYYNNTMCSFGPMTRELIDSDDWYRVTPIDLTMDRTYVCDLVASNMYVIGTVEITVRNGALIVEYYIAGGNAVIKEENLMLYESLEAFEGGYGIEAEVGTAINLAETVYDDDKIIVSLILVGDYNAAQNKVKSFKINEEFLAELLENID